MKSTPAKKCELLPERVDVWYTPVESIDPQLLESYWNLLSADEAARARRFHFERDRQLYLAAHAMLRTVLSRYAAIEPQQWEFAAEGNGKPFIEAPLDLPSVPRFNLSHTRGLAVCAVTRDGEIGVDIENLERQPNILGLAQRYFSAAEAANVAALPQARRHGRFFEYWTLKESYIKAIGTGLATPLDCFAFELESGGPPRISFAQGVDDRPADWQFAQFRIGDGFQGGLAIRNSPQPVTIAAAKTVPLAEQGIPQILPANAANGWSL